MKYVFTAEQRIKGAKANAHQKREKTDREIRNGTYTVQHNSLFVIKNFLLREMGHKCQSCFWEFWQLKPIPLEVHHANGNAKDNALTNLQLLCPNCHAMTDTYKGKNKGFGRKSG